MITSTSQPVRFGTQSDISPLRCVVCKRPFQFTRGEAAVVLRHVAYYYDFAHAGRCLAAAFEQIFPEPGYDCAAFGPDHERARVLCAQPDEADTLDGVGLTNPVGSVKPLRYLGSACRA